MAADPTEQEQQRIDAVDEARIEADKKAASLKERDKIRQRIARAEKRKQVEIELLAGQDISVTWTKFSKQLVEAKAAVYQQLAERHEDVAEMCRELRSLERSEKDGGQYEVHPSICVQEIFEDVKQHGTLNYRGIEGMVSNTPDKIPVFRPQPGEKVDVSDPTSVYRFTGCRLCLDGDIVRLAAELLVRYALKTADHGVQDELFADAVKVVDKIGCDWATSQLLRQHRKPAPVIQSRPEPPKLALDVPDHTLDQRNYVVSNSLSWPRTV